MLKAVLFDLDGTLLEFQYRWRESRAEMIEWLRLHDFDISPIDVNTKTQAILDIARGQTDVRAELPEFTTIKESLMNIVAEYELESSRGAIPYQGTAPLLAKLRNLGMKIAVVTNNGREAVELALRDCSFSDHIAFIVTRDDVEMMKPRPEGILNALIRLDVQAEDSIFVGDSVEDMKAAAAANVRTVALARSDKLLVELKDEDPDFIIRRIEELQDIVLPDGH